MNEREIDNRRRMRFAMDEEPSGDLEERRVVEYLPKLTSFDEMTPKKLAVGSGGKIKDGNIIQYAGAEIFFKLKETDPDSSIQLREWQTQDGKDVNGHMECSIDKSIIIIRENEIIDIVVGSHKDPEFVKYITLSEQGATVCTGKRGEVGDRFISQALDLLSIGL